MFFYLIVYQISRRTKTYKYTTDVLKKLLKKRLVNARPHKMFQPVLIYIFDLTVFWLTFLQRDNRKEMFEFKKFFI